MKNTLLCIMVAVLCLPQLSIAQKKKQYNENGEIIKTGWNFGPLPVVGFDSDLGFQYGVCCDIFHYGNGELYPQYKLKMNVEASTYTKGSSILRFSGNMPDIGNGTKLFVDACYFNANKYEFLGYNGYEAYYDPAYLLLKDPDSETPSKSAFYYLNRRQFRFVASVQRPLFNINNFYWAAGLAYYNTHINRINIADYDSQYTLYECYRDNGLIRDNEAHGGNTLQIRAGIIYDTRDLPNDPTSGIYFEGSLAGAPDFIDKNGYSHLTSTLIWRQYLSVWNNKLTFSYRIGAQNLFAGEMPWHTINNLNTLFFSKLYTEALGSNNTIRGVDRNRVVGEGFLVGNLELRWRVVGFQFINQNWIIGVNPFFDAGMITQTFRDEEIKEYKMSLEHPEDDKLFTNSNESMHFGAGCGLKIIMNRNLIVSVDVAKALDNRDGQKLKTYIGFNYIF